MSEIHVGADGHVHFTDPQRERFANDVYRYGEQLLSETAGGELSEALEAAQS